MEKSVMSVRKEVVSEWQQMIDFDGDALIIAMAASVVYVMRKKVVLIPTT